MKQTRNFLRQLLWIFVVTATIAGFHACDDDDLSSPLTLQYIEVGNIGTGMLFTSTPYYKGATPSEFSIIKVKLNGEEVENKGFEVNAETGVITITHNNQLAPGKYTVSIGCKVNNSQRSFADVLTVNMLPAAPATFKYKEPLITSPYGRFDTAYVAEIGESVEISKFVLADAGDATYFKIDAVTGTVCWKEFSIAETPEPRHYYPAIGIVTPAGTSYYNNVLEFNITSAPMELKYEIATIQTEKGYSDTSAMPVYMGSPDQLVYAIKSAKCGDVTTDKIHIDKDGRIYVDKNNEEMVQGEYKISLSVTNQYGNKDFDDVFSWNIVNYIVPIKNFSYAETSGNRFKEFSVAVAADFEGDGVTFSFIDKPASLTDLTIDATTGTISAPQGHKITVGDYNIDVKAVNSKDPEGDTTTFVLHIKEHPNYFSLTYGNNLGLTPAANYANQFSYTYPATGIPITFSQLPTISPSNKDISFEIVHQKSTYADFEDGKGIKLNNTTGEISTSITKEGWTKKAGGILYALIKATKGTGDDMYSVETPVFIRLAPRLDANVVNVKYEPFVLKVNPKTGATSQAPTYESKPADLVSTMNLVIDYKEEAQYYDFSGKSSLSGLTATSGTLLNQLWKTYGVTNFSSREPISGIDKFESTSSKKLCYVKQDSYQIVVNPEIWKDAEGKYAKGAFIARMAYATNGKDPATVSGAGACFPVVIWFDPEF